MNIKSSLVERIKDKEAIVRVHASLALSRLQVIWRFNFKDCEDVNEEDSESSIQSLLLNLLRHDPSP